MKLKIKKIKIENKIDVPIFLNFILYNDLIKIDESNYSYHSKKYFTTEFYEEPNKLTSSIVDYSKISFKNEK